MIFADFDLTNIHPVNTCHDDGKEEPIKTGI